MDLGERKVAEATQERLRRDAQAVSLERTGRTGHRWHPSSAGTGRAAHPTAGNGGPELFVDGDGLVEENAAAAKPVGGLGVEPIELVDEGRPPAVEHDTAMEIDARGAPAAEVTILAGVAGRRR